MPDPNAKTQKRKKSIGKPLQLSDEQLDAAAQVTDQDIAEARALWEANAPARYKALLDAKQEENLNA